MDFSFSEEQTLLQNSVQRFIQNDYTFEQRQKLLKSDEGFSRENWASFAELGWLGLPFSEEAGGFGGGPIETMILMEEFGKGLVVEPYLSTVLLAGKLIEQGGNAAQIESLLAEIIAGESLGAFAFVEPQARFNLANITTRAEKGINGFVVNGFKGVVLGGPSADFFIVPARTAGDQSDTDGISLFVIKADAEGLSRRDYPTIDGLRASELTLEDILVTDSDLIGGEGKGYKLIEQVIDSAIIAVGAEAAGAMEVLYKTTVEYCKTREQFGQPIGKFQVLQHRMVDMFVEHEQTKSLVYMAAMRLDEDYGELARKAISGLKVQVGKGGRFVGQSAIQLHGGMGMTDELNVGHYFKRLTTIDTLFGNVDYHLRKYSQVA
ncbi:MAG TPA: acyl-CoA dehydrogenase family protein [Pseudomonadales bacterium]|mgnify:CR=1 FL=1|jgi:alkylation response protein AidB-like acyl-CoA dehydrogenase|nr:pimeloyl-CoA dehydrogenase small subunit [Gammaproteobacteria bacterium]MDP6024464.1 acyl-CoA dehydrogenase family protein [Pseudomonadales bacterium]MDP6316923.1 acyl-CoA dehydrogenase family protein [Pseudomonadales bacterium]MDP7313884.1 acyl-CoA dehydrogenase family protein [Pseudomonadales bacterium]HJL61000.1 acyl-CoA dehydrogenase family protein [Pseudomonadales bacterium]|tara:strand:+ start:13683 stop:14816 length:1134 start_codon:yes stop_codon:yes gene_type:complete